MRHPGRRHQQTCPPHQQQGAAPRFLGYLCRHRPVLSHHSQPLGGWLDLVPMSWHDGTTQSRIAVPGNIITSRHVWVHTLKLLCQALKQWALSAWLHWGVSSGMLWLLLATHTAAPCDFLESPGAWLGRCRCKSGTTLHVGRYWPTCLGQILLHACSSRREGGSQGLGVRENSGISQCHVECTCV